MNREFTKPDYDCSSCVTKATDSPNYHLTTRDMFRNLPSCPCTIPDPFPAAHTSCFHTAELTIFGEATPTDRRGVLPVLFSSLPSPPPPPRRAELGDHVGRQMPSPAIYSASRCIFIAKLPWSSVINDGSVHGPCIRPANSCRRHDTGRRTTFTERTDWGNKERKAECEGEGDVRGR